MAAYDPQQPDSYAVHLAQLKIPAGVVATRDIHNQEGVLLVKKGGAVKAETVQRLLNHKLVQPLETSVSLADAVTGQQLFDDIIAMLRADKECQAIHQTLELDDALRQQCQLYATLTLITQKTTVQKMRFQAHYQHAIFCAWFGLALAVQMGGNGLQSSAFIAGLVHDMGLLHIDPETVTKTHGHSAEQLRALQSHTLIADMFLSFVAGLPRDVRRAVREHHEHYDGTGYPAGLFSENLCTLGRIVAITDSVWLACKNASGSKVQTLAEVITLTKMNAVQQSPFVLTALYNIQQKANLNAPAVLPAARIEEALEYLIETEQTLRAQFCLVEQLKSALPTGHAHRQLRSVHLKTERLWLIVTTSGLLTDTLSHWLQEVNTKNDAAAALHIHDMSLMYKELQWQLAQLGRSLQQLLVGDVALSGELRSKVEAVVASLHGQGVQGWIEQQWGGVGALKHC